MSLPKNEKSFFFSHEGETNGHKYEGQFSVKCVLSMADKRILEIEQSRLSMDLMNPTNDLVAISRVVANLRVRVQEAPDWFDQIIGSLDILDDNVIFELYGECLTAAQEWRDDVKKKANPVEEKSEGNLQAES
jgi:hypothetical protein